MTGAGPATIPAAELLANVRRDTSDGVLWLASHAALPVVVDAGFVNLLRVNFFLDPPDELPFEAEADLLLSPLCREIGDELYELDPAVRNLLLIMLQSRYGLERVRQVALLLEQYTQSSLTWTAQPELEQAQQLTALSFIDPALAQAWLDDAQTGPRSERLSHDWYVAMRARLAARPTAAAAQDELAAALAALDDRSAQIRLGAVNTLTVLSQLPGTDLASVIDALARMLRTRATSRVDRIGRDIQGALTLIGTLPRQQRPVDLTGVWLAQADLRHLDLSGSKLVNATLFNCQAEGIFLTGAELWSADLVDVTADGANLSSADLTSSTLGRVSLRGASLVRTWLHEAVLIDVDLSGADLTNAVLPSTRAELAGRGVSFSAATLTGTQFRGGNADSSSAGPDVAPSREPAGIHLSRGEAEVLALLRKGRSVRQIAAELKISVPAVELYSAQILAKFNVQSWHDLVPDDSGLAELQRVDDLLEVAYQHHQAGDLEAAGELVTDAIVILRNYPGGDLARLASALLRRAELYLLTSDSESARRDAEEAVEIYRELSPADGLSPYAAELAEALSVLASLLTDDQSTTLAATYDESIALYKQVDRYGPGLATTLLNQARWLMRTGRLPEAMTAAEESRLILTDNARLAACQQTLGDIASLQKNYEQAAAHYRQARDYAREAGLVQEEGIATYRLGDTLRNLGDNEAAIATLQESTEFFVAFNDVPWEAISRRTAGQLLVKVGRPNDAIGTLQVALTLFQSLGDAPMSALTMSDLGEALLEAGQLQNAVGVLQDALGTVRRLQYREAEAPTLQRLGRALRAVDRVSEAHDALRQAYRLFSGTRYETSAIQELLNLEASALENGFTPSVFYLVCDTSNAMTDASMQALNFWLAALPSSLPRYPLIGMRQLSVIGFSDYAYAYLPSTALDQLPVIPSVSSGGEASYAVAFDFLRGVIVRDLKLSKPAGPGSSGAVVFFITAGGPRDDRWRPALRRLLADPGITPPLVLAFGLNDADEDFIGRVSTFAGFIADERVDAVSALDAILSRFADCLPGGQVGTSALPTRLPGFRNVAPIADDPGAK